MKYLIFILLASVLLTVSCTKTSKYCWQRVDQSGQDIGAVCDKTEDEMHSLYGNPCGYYQLGGDNHCWFIDSTVFIKDQTEAFINHYIKCFGRSHAVIVACDYCQVWNTRQKITYKSNNSTEYSRVSSSQFCGDTVHTLYKGREVIIKDTPDSLIVVQFTNNGIF